MTTKRWLILILSVPLIAACWFGLITYLRHTGKHKILIPVESLRRTEKVWSGFKYFPVRNAQQRAAAINDLVASTREASSDDTAQLAALLEKLLVGYGSPSWPEFEAFRFPTREFHVSEETRKALARTCACPEVAKNDFYAQYRKIWEDAFPTPLWDEVAFFPESLTFMDRTKTEGYSFELPDFVTKTNQNWLGRTLAGAFEYNAALSRLTESGGKARFLRLSFLSNVQSGERKDHCAFMFILFWDPVSQHWLPYRFSQSFVREPMHDISFF